MRPRRFPLGYFALPALVIAILVVAIAAMPAAPIVDVAIRVDVAVPLAATPAASR